MTQEQLDKIYEHLSLFNSLRYIALDLHATETLSFDNNDNLEKSNTDFKHQFSDELRM